MYVCICNAITDTEVLSAADDGASTHTEVFEQLGAQPQCGRCFETMRGLLDAPKTSGRCRRRQAA